MGAVRGGLAPGLAATPRAATTIVPLRPAAIGEPCSRAIEARRRLPSRAKPGREMGAMSKAMKRELPDILHDLTIQRGVKRQ